MKLCGTILRALEVLTHEFSQQPNKVSITIIISLPGKEIEAQGRVGKLFRVAHLVTWQSEHSNDKGLRCWGPKTEHLTPLQRTCPTAPISQCTGDIINNSNNSKHYRMITMCQALFKLQILTHLALPTTQWNRFYYYSHCTDRNTEAQGG